MPSPRNRITFRARPPSMARATSLVRSSWFPRAAAPRPALVTEVITRADAAASKVFVSIISPDRSVSDGPGADVGRASQPDAADQTAVNAERLGDGARTIIR